MKQELNENVLSEQSIYTKETLDKLKILESCINETIRWVLNIAATRQATVDTTVECSDKTQIGVRKGDMVLYPDYSKLISSGGPQHGYEHKFDIKYSYKNIFI